MHAKESGPPSAPTKTIPERQSRVAIRLGKQRYALDIKCPPSTLPPEPAHCLIATKFLHLRQPVALGECIEGWRVCWLGGWDRGKVFLRRDGQSFVCDSSKMA